MLKAVIPCVLLFACGGAGAYQNLVQEAEARTLVGDDLRAADNYARACRLAKKEKADAGTDASCRAARQLLDKQAAASAERLREACDLSKGICEIARQEELERAQKSEVAENRAVLKAAVDKVMAGEAEKRIGGARPLCLAGDLQGCRDAFEQIPAGQGVSALQEELFQQAADAHAARCRRQIVGEQAPRKIARAVCIAEAADIVPTAKVAATSKQQREESAALLLAQARGLPARSRGRYLLLAAAHQLGSSKAEPLDGMYQALVEAHGMRAEAKLLAQTVDGKDSSDVCGDLRDEVGHRLICAPGGISATITLKLNRIDTQISHESHDKRYQSGVSRQPHPKFERNSRDYEAARRAFDEVEVKSSVAKSECESARESFNRAADEQNLRDSDEVRAAHKRKLDPMRTDMRAACDRYKPLSELFDRREQELDRARQALDRTPEIVEEPIHDVHHWKTKRTRWGASYRFSIAGIGTLREDGGMLVDETTEQPGFAPAEIPAIDGKAAPTVSEFLEKAEGEALAAAADALDDQLRARARSAATKCPANALKWTASWLDCRARVQLLQDSHGLEPMVFAQEIRRAHFPDEDE